MSSNDVAIKVEQVSKTFLLYRQPNDRLKQFILPRLRRTIGMKPKHYFTTFQALRGIDLEIKRGEVFGIVGRNGSGKSTLLQIIAGTMTPTAGCVETRGRVAALLELGAGFNPEFTGRENVYLNGAILGLLPGEIDRRFDEIAAFADIGAFLDQPVKTYSSGMYMRLAFAVSACVEPEILIVDEALAVGDAAFQAKCFRRFQTLLDRGTTILFVSHSTDQITRHCSRAALLDGGTVKELGDPRHVANCYLDLIFGVARAPSEQTVHGDVRPSDPDKEPFGRLEDRPGYNRSEYRWGAGLAEIVDVVTSSSGQSSNIWFYRTSLTADVWVTFRQAIERPIYGMTIKTPDGVTVYGSNSRDFDGGPIWKPVSAGEKVRLTFVIDHHLMPGDYIASFGVAADINGELVPLDRRYDVMTLHVQNSRFTGFGLADLNMRVIVK
jgi:lipopolysaccharide transport system ATP-binding protein